MNTNDNASHAVGTLEDVTICPIASQYTAGSWAQVRATFHWRFPGRRIGAPEERAAMSAALRMAANLIDAMSEDYIRTARAKGLPERRVIRHGLRAAITPVVSAAGVDIGAVLGGVILVETVFNIPGIGRLVYESIINADVPMIQGTVLIGAFFIVIANLIVDILYAFIDPRVRYS